MINKILPNVKLAYKYSKGSIPVRQQKADKLVKNLINNIGGSLKKGKLTIPQLQEQITHILPQKIQIQVLEAQDKSYVAYSDILYSAKSKKIKGLTIELPTKNNIVDEKQLTNIAHEFQHIADQLYHPKILARNQYMETNGLYTKQYNELYDKYLYNQEFTDGKRDRKDVIKKLEQKIKHFFRGMKAEDKINYLQDARYGLILENNAYFTQYKYAKKLKKKHSTNINREDLIKWNKDLMFTEKITLLKRIAFEIIKEERQKHAFLVKKLRNVNNSSK